MQVFISCIRSTIPITIVITKLCFIVLSTKKTGLVFYPSNINCVGLNNDNTDRSTFQPTQPILDWHFIAFNNNKTIKNIWLSGNISTSTQMSNELVRCPACKQSTIFFWRSCTNSNQSDSNTAALYFVDTLVSCKFTINFVSNFANR